MGKHVGTYLTDAELRALYRHLASEKVAVPPYCWVKGLIMRELKVDYVAKPREKAARALENRLKPFKDELAGERFAREQALRVERREELVTPASSPVPEIVADSAVATAQDAVPGDSGQGEPEKASEPEPTPSSVSEAPAEAPAGPAVRVHPSTIGMKALFGKRRR